MVLHSQSLKISKYENVCPKWLRWGLGNQGRIHEVCLGRGRMETLRAEVERRRREDRGAEGDEGSEVWEGGIPFPLGRGLGRNFFRFLSSKRRVLVPSVCYFLHLNWMKTVLGHWVACTDWWVLVTFGLIWKWNFYFWREDTEYSVTHATGPQQTCRTISATWADSSLSSAINR